MTIRKAGKWWFRHSSFLLPSIQSLLAHTHKKKEVLGIHIEGLHIPKCLEILKESTVIYWIPLQYSVQSTPEMLTHMEKGQDLLLNYSTSLPNSKNCYFFQSFSSFHSQAMAHLGVPVTEQTPSKSWLSVFVWKYPGNAWRSSSREADLTHPI